MQDAILNNVDTYELSVNQRNLWLLNPENTSQFFNQLTIALDASITSEVVQSALQAVLKKNETLLFKTMKEAGYAFPRQFMDIAAGLDFHEVSTFAGKHANDVADQYLSYPYDSAKDAAVRFCYVNEDSQKLLIVRIFSFWADSFSSLLFYNDLKQALVDVSAYVSLEREVVEYQNFSAWQNELQAEPEIEGVNFWKNYEYNLGKTVIPFTDTPKGDFLPKRTVLKTFVGSEYEQLSAEANKVGSNLEHYVFARLFDYLHQFEGDKVTVGYLPYQRSYEELNNTFGLVSKPLPITLAPVKESGTNNENEIAQCLQSIDVWSDYFYLGRNGDQGDPFFNYVFEYIDGRNSRNSAIRLEDFHSIVDAFDVKLTCIDRGDALSLEVYVDTSKFSGIKEPLVVAQLKQVFGIETEASQTISSLEADIIAMANATEKTFEAYASVLEMFQKQVSEQPEATAILIGNEEISYSELDQRSNQLAQELISSYGVSKGDAVCILLGRSEWFIVSVLAIIKSGGYYVPIDTEYPKDRIQYIAQDCGAKLIITNEALKSELGLEEATTLIASDTEIYANQFAESPGVEVNSEDTIYCIYTSGSTGNPKGCLINNSNLLNYIQWANNYYFKDPNMGNWGLITSLSFDLTMTSIFTSLTRGKKLWIGGADKDVIQLLTESLQHPEVDTLKLTPTHLSLLKDIDVDETKLRLIVCGGEQLKHDQVRIVKDIHEDIQLFNEYGPTETTIGCIVQEVFPEDESILIGSPIANTDIQILDTDGKEAPIGSAGELFIGGAGVSQGYLNRKEITQERFIENPNTTGEIIYKTGDLGRWTPEGTIEYLGRIDDQIKIRGYRIELGEIEQTLVGSGMLKQAVVLPIEVQDALQLVAFVVDRNEESDEVLKGHLKKVLPEYMIPAQFVTIENIPLTVNGKVDKRQLNTLFEEAASKQIEYVAPRDEVEEQCVAIWSEVFGREGLGVKEDFFHLGGHSIKLIKLINTYQSTFGVKLELNLFFVNTTLESHAALIKSSKNDVLDDIEKAPEMESYPISLMQRRLWLLSQNKNRSIAYNMFAYDEVKGVDEACFDKAILSIIERHESLRTIFKKNAEGEIHQYILEPSEVKVDIQKIDLRGASDFGAELATFVKFDSEVPFHLEQGPLIRIALIRKSEDEYVFYRNMHHIIADNWSLEQLTKEYEAFYIYHKYGIAPNLEPLEIQYKDYSVWQLDKISSEKFNSSQQYWSEKFKGEVPKLSFVFSKERPTIKTYNGYSVNNTIKSETIREFFNHSGVEGITPFMKVLAVLNMVLYHNSFQTDIVVGSPVSGRNNPKLKDQIGVYINTIPFRTQLEVDKDFNQLLTEVKTNVIEGYKHNEYPFDLIVENLNLEADFSRNPVFDVMLVVTHDANSEVELKTSVGEEVDYDTTAKFDVTFYVEIKDDTMQYSLSVNSDLFDPEDMKLLSNQFLQLIELITSDDSRSLVSYCQEIKGEDTKIEHDEFMNALSQNLDEDF
ncbi:amino acid adenylation domain-containing protein [Aureisphaera galaxeae]|uniref:amino acid adenylation domain-containing protein n=1 Tax=Aureisphaera galaxeae TaxID=1538023 RepID=UPI00234FBB29|nr:amino acid adenylation domain-containing protein [Aureisphaera galaxeae]MDC8004719.1 amino acid adenylation domain-containing protein [Aureisphaera galaxeae]